MLVNPLRIVKPIITAFIIIKFKLLVAVVRIARINRTFLQQLIFLSPCTAFIQIESNYHKANFFQLSFHLIPLVMYFSGNVSLTSNGFSVINHLIFFSYEISTFVGGVTFFKLQCKVAYLSLVAYNYLLSVLPLTLNNFCCIEQFLILIN